MNADHYSPGAYRAVQAACGWAAAITPHQLACGLFAEEDGTAYALALKSGLRVSEWLKTQSTPAGPLDSSLTPEAENTLRLARSLAHEHFADRIVTSETLLLAIVQSAPQLVAEWAAFGFSTEGLERKVLGEALDLIPLAVEPEAVPDHRVYRILDANADRARESLRVLEDHARFALDDAILSSTLKDIRHDLAAAWVPLAASGLAYRDTDGDVGVSIESDSEYVRPNAQSVVAANAKRLQEALRSLEEYGKTVDAPFARQCEQLRYRAYAVESALGRTSRLAEARLYMLVAPRPDLEWLVRESLAGGVDVIQLRAKNSCDADLLAISRKMRQWTRGKIYIVNDRPDIARLSDADGVHLGQEDLPVGAARRIVGPDALVGVSSHNPNQLKQAVLEGANYVGIGPIFPSSTKEFSVLAGLEYIRIASAATSLPAFALGGISADNVDQVTAAGARRIAVSSAIAQSADPATAARILKAKLPAV